jgi:Arc/MetJ family transcription regulator
MEAWRRKHGLARQGTLLATGLRTRREAVELWLRTILRPGKQKQIRKLRGKLDWRGDLDAMRIDH